MTRRVVESTQKDREQAAQLWCLPQHSSKEMDSDFAESIASALAQARAEGRAEMIQVAKDAWPRAHTYASENADLYRAGDAARDRIIQAMEAAAKGGGR